MEYKAVKIPKKIEKINDKLSIEADKYDGDTEKRAYIHATIAPEKKLTAIVIGLNPSTADLDRSDYTFIKVGRYLSQYDVQDFYMLNLYETVSSNLDDIKEIEITNWESHRRLFESADFILLSCWQASCQM